MGSRKGFKYIACEVPDDFYYQLEELCNQNNEKISSLIRRALRREVSYTSEFEILSECEKLIDKKLEQYAVISVKAKKIK